MSVVVVVLEVVIVKMFCPGEIQVFSKGWPMW
jgi:hypothetical protein